MNRNPLTVACIGECMLELAQAGSTSRLGFGGDTLNTAVYLARELGSSARVAYVTALGDDPMSDDMTAAWAGEGVDTSEVQRIAGALPGLYLIRTDAAGERSFFYWRRDAAVRRLLEPGRIERVARFLAGCELVYLSGISRAVLGPALLDVLDEARATGARIAFDTNYRPALWSSPGEAADALREIAPRVHIALPGADDERALFDEREPDAIGRRWLDWGVPEVVVKDGAAGCVVCARDEATQIPAVADAVVVDTTAAGDAFNAGYLAARLRGASTGDAARRAHDLAARVIGHAGAID